MKWIDFCPIPIKAAHGTRSHRHSIPSMAGLTAIEVLVSLVVLSVVAVFSLHALEYSRRIYLETEQMDFCAQTARDILNQLLTGQDWQTVRTQWEEAPIPACGTDFNVQFEEQTGEEEGVVNLEVTISWVSPRGLESQVFNTSVFDQNGDKPR